MQQSSSKREVYSNTFLPQETANISNKQPNFEPKTIREKRTKKHLNVSRTKEIIKIRSEINEKAMKEVYSNTSLHKETGNISNKQPNLAPKAFRERRTKKAPKLAEGKQS